MRSLLSGILGTLILIYILSIGVMKLPFLTVHSVTLEGIREGEFKKIKPVITSLGKKLIFMGEGELLTQINRHLGNRFRKLEINREFTKEGINLSIRLIRRKAVAKAFIDGKAYLLSENGKLFWDENQKVNKYVYFRGINRVNKKVINLLRYADKIYVYKNGLKLKLGDKTVFLPLNFSRREISLLESIIRNDESNYKEVDLRYKRFILLRKKL